MDRRLIYLHTQLEEDGGHEEERRRRSTDDWLIESDFVFAAAAR